MFRPTPKPRRIPQPSSLAPITLGRRTDPLDAWISELQHEGLELNLAAHFTA